MHTFGKVLMTLNLLLVLVFVVFTAPVVKYRQKRLADVDREEAKIPGLGESIAELDRRRVRALEETTVADREIGDHAVAGANERSRFEKRLAELTDAQNDMNDGHDGVMKSMQLLRSRVGILDQEANEIQARIATKEAENRVLHDEVEKLRDELNQTQGAFERTKDEIFANYEELRRRTLGPQAVPPSSTENRPSR